MPSYRMALPGTRRPRKATGYRPVDRSPDRGLVRSASIACSSVTFRNDADAVTRVSQHGDHRWSRLYSRRIRMGERELGVAPPALTARRMSRRSMVRLGMAVAALPILAACGGTAAPAPKPTDAPKPTTAPAAAPPAAAASPAAAAPAAAAA